MDRISFSLIVSFLSLIISSIAVFIAYLTYRSRKPIDDITKERLLREEKENSIPRINFKEIDPNPFGAPRIKITNGPVKLNNVNVKIDFLDQTDKSMREKIIEKLAFPTSLHSKEEKEFEINMNPSTRVQLRISLTADNFFPEPWDHEFVRGNFPFSR